ncbi:hypothetical protein GCM10009832_26230 [Dietzia kunjamensis subsp. schimae]|uniref:hypothetical protein n=1 Tax=Dietzia kunjamensis TaxID=322509 RepID=UPI0012B6B6DE|nr:hypothetical protein [Dietzia kunjamensis]MBB1014489.1 hypothetical protein [Dietzia kunjamensis subsp. schimae]
MSASAGAVAVAETVEVAGAAVMPEKRGARTIAPAISIPSSKTETSTKITITAVDGPDRWSGIP